MGFEGISEVMCPLVPGRNIPFALRISQTGRNPQGSSIQLLPPACEMGVPPLAVPGPNNSVFTRSSSFLKLWSFRNKTSAPHIVGIGQFKAILGASALILSEGTAKELLLVKTLLKTWTEITKPSHYLVISEIWKAGDTSAGLGQSTLRISSGDSLVESKLLIF